MSTPPPTLHVLEDDRAQSVLLLALIEEIWPDAAVTTSVRLSEAVELLGCVEDPPVAILADLHVPDAAGVAIITGLRRAAPEALIVVLSARAFEAEAETLMTAGADRFLAKDDLTPASLFAALDLPS